MGTVDLHQLIRREGADEVAAVAGVSPGQIKHHRAGSREVGVDVLYRLWRTWDDFDVVRTIAWIGQVRSNRSSHPPDSKDMGSRKSLVEIRQAYSISVEYLSMLLGVSDSTVKRWEEGAETPSAEAKARLRHLFPNCDVVAAVERIGALREAKQAG